MHRHLLLFLGTVSISTGVCMLAAPETFFELIPGLALMGPFNVHLVRDVGLAFLASGGAMSWGAWRRNRSVALCGSCWPAMHALFHLQIWIARGLPFDQIFFFDLTTVMATAALAVWAAARLEPERRS